MWRIVAEHELRGVAPATVLPGVREVPAANSPSAGIRRGVLTQQPRSPLSDAITPGARSRNRGGPRRRTGEAGSGGRPAASAASGSLDPRHCIMVGDYRFDIEAGRQAGTRTILFTGASDRHGMLPGESADLVLASFAEPKIFWHWADQIALGTNP